VIINIRQNFSAKLGKISKMQMHKKSLNYRQISEKKIRYAVSAGLPDKIIERKVAR